MIRLLVALILIALVPNTQAEAADPRQVFSRESPAYLRSVGRLDVPGYRYISGERSFHREHCTASLIGSDIILSGWHCLEVYTDLSKSIRFTLPNVDGQPQRLARLIAKGSGMASDWALLRLQRPITGQLIEPLALLEQEPLQRDSSLLAAGYSRDPGLGQRGAVLTYHSGCFPTRIEADLVTTNCLVFKGASGGPVLNEGRVVGVISKGDSSSTSFFVPISSFMGALRAHLPGR